MCAGVLSVLDDVWSEGAVAPLEGEVGVVEVGAGGRGQKCVAKSTQ